MSDAWLITGKLREQNSLSLAYSFSDASCSFPRAYRMAKFEMARRQNKIKAKHNDK